MRDIKRRLLAVALVWQQELMKIRRLNLQCVGKRVSAAPCSDVSHTPSNGLPTLVPENVVYLKKTKRRSEVPFSYESRGHIHR